MIKNKLLIILKIIIFIAFFIYSLVSIKYISNWYNNYSYLQSQLNELKIQQHQLQSSINVLKLKVTGLQEESINLSVLETQSKTILHMQNKNEKIFIK